MSGYLCTTQKEKNYLTNYSTSQPTSKVPMRMVARGQVCLRAMLRRQVICKSWFGKYQVEQKIA